MSLCPGCTKPGAAQVRTATWGPQKLQAQFPSASPQLCCDSLRSLLLSCCVFLQPWLMKTATLMPLAFLALENGPKPKPSPGCAAVCCQIAAVVLWQHSRGLATMGLAARSRRCAEPFAPW